ncbi:Uncharacterised protein [Bordetella pertussis]|nr:Uncharacterised protein [Bordetella pertussis]
MPMNTTGIWNSCAASEIMKPSPFCAPTSSAATTTAQLRAMATFSPVKIWGIDDGNTTRQKICSLVMPMDSAAR